MTDVKKTIEIGKKMTELATKQGIEEGRVRASEAALAKDITSNVLRNDLKYRVRALEKTDKEMEKLKSDLKTAQS